MTGCGRHWEKGCQTQMRSLVSAGAGRWMMDMAALAFHAEVAASHVRRLRLAEDAEKSRRNVAKCAAGGQLNAVFFANENERNRIGGVISVRAAGCRVDHGFGVAVVGGDDPGATARLQSLVDASEAGV